MNTYAMTTSECEEAATSEAALIKFFGADYKNNEVYKEYAAMGYPVLVQEEE